MQRYRVNYRWLIGVFVGSIIIAITAYFVWSWQVNRKAGFFLDLAAEATASEKHGEAFTALRKYVKLRPDEEDARIKMGEAAIEVIKSKDSTLENRGLAFGILDQTVRTTDNSKLRRELAGIVSGFRPQDAIGHVEELLVDSPDDPELNAMLARALYQSKDYRKFKELAFQIVGYDRKAEEFAEEKTDLAKEVEVYALLAQVLFQTDKNTDLARRVIDEMVTANPDSAQAYLSKSIFLSGLDEKEAAIELLDKAYELDPKSAAILSRKGLVALDDDDFETAKKYFDEGLKEHPDIPFFYRLMADADYRLDDKEASLKILDQGIAHLSETLSVDLKLYKLDLLFGEEDYDAINDEIEKLAKLSTKQRNLLPIVDFQKARVLYSEKDWFGAAAEFKRIRPLLLDRNQYQVMAGLLLGNCYERQGKNDLALQTYNTILSTNPNHEGALRGIAKFESYFAKRNNRNKDADLNLIVTNTLNLPEDEQDWDKVEELVKEVIAENELSETAQKLLRSKILVKRSKFEEAKALIREAAKEAPEDLDVQYTAILLIATDPAQGPEPALKLLDRLEKKWGRTLRSRAQRADLLADLRPSDVTEQLRALVTDIEDLNEREVSHLYKVLGFKFEQLNMLDESQEFYAKAAQMEPNNLPIAMHMFELALRKRDDDAMQKAQEALLKLVKSKRDPSYLLTEVRRQMMNYSQRKIEKSELEKSRDLLDSALRQRPQWHELHVAYGQLLLLLEADVDLALKHFDDALEYGPAKANAINIQTKLLYERGLYAQARERMELLRPARRSQVLGQLEAEILMKTGDKEEGYKKAKEFAATQPDNIKVREWLAKLAQEMGDLEYATESIAQALELNSSNPDYWLNMIGLLTEQKKFNEIPEILREAHLASDAEYLPLFTGKQYEMMSRWQMAEDLYLAIYTDRLDELPVVRRMADFYLFWSKKEEANVDKAAVYINMILRAANEGQAASDNPHVVWARQKAAKILLTKNDYQQSLKAERLLRQSAVNQQMSDAETELLTDILVGRADPASLLQAKQLLTELRDNGRIHKKGAMQLAQILSRTNEVEATKSLMLELIAKYPSDPQVRALYIELLLDQGEFSAAERQLRQLRDLNPENATMIQLSARIASEKGDKVQLTKLLYALAPNTQGSLNEAQLNSILGVAQLATRYDALDVAEKLNGVYVARLPDQAYVLARFHAYHGDCDKAVELMKRLFSQQMDDVAQLANQMLTKRREEIGDKYDEQLDRFLDAAIRDDPDSITRLLARAEAYNSQGKHAESIKAYEDLLKREDLPVRLRAAAMNNLGFQLGLLNQRVDEAEQLINNAMETFGPVEDMLDTRAVVRMSQGKLDQAIEDLELAISVSHDPIKYYHLAKAYILAGNGPSAFERWKDAQRLGFVKDSLSILEKDSFDGVVEQIEASQNQNARL